MKSSILLTGASALALAASSAAFAQSAPSEKAGGPAATTVNEIVVTGSRISHPTSRRRAPSPH